MLCNCVTGKKLNAETDGPIRNVIFIYKAFTKSITGTIVNWTSYMSRLMAFDNQWGINTEWRFSSIAKIVRFETISNETKRKRCRTGGWRTPSAPLWSFLFIYRTVCGSLVKIIKNDKFVTIWREAQQPYKSSILKNVRRTRVQNTQTHSFIKFTFGTNQLK